jgi:hypothetical protein
MGSYRSEMSCHKEFNFMKVFLKVENKNEAGRANSLGGNPDGFQSAWKIMIRGAEED